MRVKNAYVKDNRGRSELHLNNNSLLEINPEGVDVRGGFSGDDSDYKTKKINELSQGDFRVELIGTVVQVYDPRFFQRGDSEGVVVNVLIDDGTGNVRCACWGELAAKVLSSDEKSLFANKDKLWEDEKTALLGNIVRIKGRAKLNTIYNTIELSVDEIDLNPEPAANDDSTSAGSEAPVELNEQDKKELLSDDPVAPGLDDIDVLDDLDDLDDLDI